MPLTGESRVWASKPPFPLSWCGLKPAGRSPGLLDCRQGRWEVCSQGSLAGMGKAVGVSAPRRTDRQTGLEETRDPAQWPGLEVAGQGSEGVLGGSRRWTGGVGNCPCAWAGSEEFWDGGGNGCRSGLDVADGCGVTLFLSTHAFVVECSHFGLMCTVSGFLAFFLPGRDFIARSMGT